MARRDHSGKRSVAPTTLASDRGRLHEREIMAESTSEHSSVHPTVHGLHSRVIGRVELDEARLQAELATALQLPFNRGYSDYARGNPGWQNCVLMNHSGDPTDQVFGGHPGPPVPTPHLDELPYFRELLDTTFSTEHLKWARIFLCEDGMLIPHRDYLDLPEDEFTRVHIALKLGPASLHSEGDQLYRMRKGEVWFIDGTVAHSAASYDGEPRVYLTCDFTAGVDFADLFADPTCYAENVEPDFVDRMPLPDNFDEALAGIATLMDRDTLNDTLAMLSKVHYNHVADCADTYEWLIAAAQRTGDNDLVEAARERRSFFLGI